jgi:Tfp pilus assembly protein FimV
VLGGVWALFKVRQLEERLAQQEGVQRPTTQGREQELQQQLEQQNARADELAAELRRAQEQRAKLDDEIAALKSQERPPTNVTNRRPAPTVPAVASVFLPLMQSRSPGQEPTLNILPGAARAQLILDLDVLNPASYKSFRAEVYEVDGPLIESSNKLNRQKRGGGNRVVLSLPADRFSTGEYRVVLSGLTESGQQEPIGIYHFRVRANTP